MQSNGVLIVQNRASAACRSLHDTVQPFVPRAAEHRMQFLAKFFGVLGTRVRVEGLPGAPNLEKRKVVPAGILPYEFEAHHSGILPAIRRKLLQQLYTFDGVVGREVYIGYNVDAASGILGLLCGGVLNPQPAG